jgi:hypothetical protein
MAINENIVSSGPAEGEEEVIGEIPVYEQTGRFIRVHAVSGSYGNITFNVGSEVRTGATILDLEYSDGSRRTVYIKLADLLKLVGIAVTVEEYEEGEADADK